MKQRRIGMSTKAAAAIHRIVNLRNGAELASTARIADSFMSRTVGLLGRFTLPEGHALLIPGCRMVHMFFMRFPIDVLFCTAEHVVLDMQHNLRPWRVSRYVFGARSVLELPAGVLESADVRIGDRLKVEPLRSER